MGETLAAQLWDFCYVAFGTVMLGGLIDMLRAVHQGFRLSGLLSHLVDGIMWALATAGYLAWLYVGVGLPQRVYVIVAAIFGLWLYFALGSPTVYPALLGLVRLTVRIAGVLTWPLRWLFARRIFRPKS